MRDVIDQVDIFITTTGNKDIIMAEDMAKMKNNAIVGNIGHFDNEIDMAGVMSWPGIKRQNIKPQVGFCRRRLLQAWEPCGCTNELAVHMSSAVDLIKASCAVKGHRLGTARRQPGD